MKKNKSILMISLVYVLLWSCDKNETYELPNKPTEPTSTGYYVNVMDYGAKNDGTFPADSAFRKALTVALGKDPEAVGKVNVKKSLYIPAGEYLLTKPIVIRDAIGLVIRTDGNQNTLLALAEGVHIEKGGVVQIYSCAFLNIPEGFKIKAKNVWSNNATAESGLSIDEDYNFNTRLQGVVVQGLKCKYGFALGHNSANRDVAGIHLIDCVSAGRFVPGITADPNWYQAAFKSGSGVDANILDHFYDHATFIDFKHGFYLENIVSVNILNSSGAHAESVLHVTGNMGTIGFNGGRVEGSFKLLTTGTGSTWPLQISMKNYFFQPALGTSLRDRRVIELKHNGTFMFENIILSPDAEQDPLKQGYKIYCGDPYRNDTQVNISINGLSTPNHTVESLFEPTRADAKVYATINNMFWIGTGGGVQEKINDAVWKNGL